MMEEGRRTDQLWSVRRAEALVQDKRESLSVVWPAGTEMPFDAEARAWRCDRQRDRQRQWKGGAGLMDMSPG